MVMTGTTHKQKSSCHDPDFPVVLRHELNNGCVTFWNYPDDMSLCIVLILGHLVIDSWVSGCAGLSVGITITERGVHTDVFHQENLYISL